MPTTRHRINLTLTDAERHALTSLATPGTPLNAALTCRWPSGRKRHRRTNGGDPIDAELVHIVLAIGLEQLEAESAAASYAAEAAAYSEEDRALGAARVRQFAAGVRDDA
jgi:hypothetical protein